MTGRDCAPQCASEFDGLQGDGVLDDAGGVAVNTTCFVLVDKTVFEPPEAPRPEASARRDATDLFSAWCSYNGTGLGPGWLPLQWRTAALLMAGQASGSEAAHSSFKHYSDNPTSDGYAAVSPTGHGFCPEAPGLEQLLTKPLRSQPGEASRGSPSPKGTQLMLGVGSSSLRGSAGSCKPGNATAAAADVAAIAYSLTLNGRWWLSWLVGNCHIGALWQTLYEFRGLECIGFMDADCEKEKGGARRHNLLPLLAVSVQRADRGLVRLQRGPAPVS